MVWVKEKREVGEMGGVVGQEWMRRRRRGRGKRESGATEAEFLPPDSERAGCDQAFSTRLVVTCQFGEADALFIQRFSANTSLRRVSLSVYFCSLLQHVFYKMQQQHWLQFSTWTAGSK